MVTLREVAKRAGVSIKTVSRIVNSDPAVRAETRDVVQSFLKEMNYVPDQAARLMRSGTSNIIGLMTDAVATTPYSVDIVRGAQAELKREHRTLLIANTDGDPELEAEYWRMFRAQKVAAVIYAAMYHRPQAMGHPDFSGSIVLANCFSKEGDRVSVIPDDEAGGFTQAEYLLKRGHRRIGIITLNPTIEATRLRARGMRRAFAAAGVPFNEDREKAGYKGPVSNETLMAFDVAVAMLKGQDRPTAIICGNDKLALQVYSAAAHLGLSIPQDLSVMGFDDLTVISESVWPTLTTVGLPYFEIGRMAVEMLKLASEEKVGWAPKVLVPCPLVERNSCRNLV
ncbi:MAG: LacI family DNA-binding transcriptional regulator [Rhizobiaceae bacterium]